MGTTAQKLQAILDSKAAIKSAIESKGVTVGSAPLDQYASKIGQISGGQEEDYMDDVIFIDYDGKVLYRYTAQEFLALTELPANPTHEGLTSQGWNWTLSEAKDYVTAYRMLTIGQMYITTDGKTRLFITLDDANYLSPEFNFMQPSSNVMTINWGDGSQAETVTSVGGTTTVNHTFPQTGDYVVEIEALTGTVVLGSSKNYQPLISSKTAPKLKYTSALKKVYLGNSTFTQTGAFYNCVNLEAITTPNINNLFVGNTLFPNTRLKAFIFPRGYNSSVYSEWMGCSDLKVVAFPGNYTSTYFLAYFQRCGLVRLEFPIGSYAPNNTAQYCANLRTAIIPYGITKLDGNIFQGSEKLTELKIPDTVTSLGMILRDCYALTYLYIGSGVTTIANYAWDSSIILQEVHITAIAPPTIGSATFPSTFFGTIYVPSGSVNDYKTATNWNAYADKIFAEPTT